MAFINKKQALCISSVASMLDNFNRNNINILLNMGYEVTLAANFNTKEDINSQEKIQTFRKEMKLLGIHIVQIDFSRSIKKIGMQVKSVLQVKKLLKKQFDLIHCHSPICAAIVRMEAEKYRKKHSTKIIYTAHGFHFYTGAPILSWFLFYPVEKWLSRLTDVLITINKEDFKRAKKFFHAGKVAYIPGVGIDTQKFRKDSIDIEDKRKKLGLKKDDIMLLSVGELSTRKNHGIIMEALEKLNDNRLHYFIAGIGNLEQSYTEKISQLRSGKNIHLLGFRTDISELCQAADLYIFPSLQEGFPAALMEAISCMTPVICSNISGNTDLVTDYRCMFNPKDIFSVSECLKRITASNDRMKIAQIMESSVKSNHRALSEFNLTSVKKHMESLYHSNVGERLKIRLNNLYFMAVKQEFQSNYGISDADIILLSVGELNKNKNHEMAIRALAQLKDEAYFSRIKYFICGKGVLKDYLLNLIQELDLVQQVYLLGYRDDMQEILKIANIFLFPSKREGLPAALMEAMASGLPSIVTQIRGSMDLIREGIEGHVVSLNEMEMAEAIKLLIKEDIETIGNNARKRIQKFDYQIVEKKMVQLYQ